MKPKQEEKEKEKKEKEKIQDEPLYCRESTQLQKKNQKKRKGLASSRSCSSLAVLRVDAATMYGELAVL